MTCVIRSGNRNQLHGEPPEKDAVKLRSDVLGLSGEEMKFAKNFNFWAMLELKRHLNMALGNMRAACNVESVEPSLAVSQFEMYLF